ncbi:MAG: hypothetical protein HF982_05955 [Desulfobacteraceae bacterium]|nr:hypothetical protein [Desulfobacteraceae bacterium]MBC2719120.1 hypothetical protein [Desulfobacteraceae bacterium]
MENSLSQIANILLIWGPAGAATVLIIIGEKKLRTKWENAKGNDRKICAWLYVGNWAFIAVLIGVVSVSWFVEKSTPDITLSGVFQDFMNPLKISKSSMDLYTRKQLKSAFLYDVYWHYIEPETPLSVEFRLDTSKTDWQDYKIDLSTIENKRKINVIYQGKKLFLISKNGRITLEPIHSASGDLKKISSNISNKFYLFIGNAYASKNVTNDQVVLALESDDSYIRQATSNHILDNMTKLISWIDSTLKNPDTSILSQIGIISALSSASYQDLVPKENRKLSQEAEDSIFLSALSSDLVLSKQSQKYVNRNPTERFLYLFDKHCPLKKINEKEREKQCSYVGMNLYYNYAIKLSQEAIDQDEFNIAKIDKAIQILHKAEGFWELANEEDKVQFAKINYGLALLYFNLSKAYSSKNMLNEKSFAIKETENNFSKMLDFIKKFDPENYEYQHHILQAKCFLKEKSQRCIEATSR